LALAAAGGYASIRGGASPTVAPTLRGALAGPEAQGVAGRPPGDSAAQALYLRGRYLWRTTQLTREATLQAGRFYAEAIARDSGYAPAYAGLSEVHARLAIFGYGLPHEEFPVAKALARRAIALDSALAPAHTALGHTLFTYDYDWSEAERSFRRAIDLDDGYPFARILLALCVSSQGRFDEAIAQLDTARAADPMSPLVPNILGRVYVSARLPDLAIRELEAALELNPQLDMAHQQLGWAYLQEGMADEAIDAFRRAATLSGPRDSAHLAYAYATTGRRAEAERIMRTLVDSTGGRYVLPFHVAVAHAGLGDTDAALQWLERSYEERGSFMNGVAVTPAFDALHSDPRWASLMRRMGLEGASRM
ncbi:MAG: tetratricopeptide repeat protein, partial [Longimicrobiales bacterium]